MDGVMTKDKTGNEMGKAFLFSGLVMIIGAIAWGICYYTGFLSSWVECIATIIAAIVFHKFYNKFDWKIWVWVIGLSCVLNVLSLFVTSAIAIASKTDVSIVAGFSALIEILGADSETARLFLIDVISAVLFTAIGAVLGITIQLKIYKNKKLQETASAAVKAAEVAADGETVVQVDYDAIIANLEARLKNYIETKDKEALDKDVEDFKKNCEETLTPAQIKALKLKAKALRAQDNSSVPERALACDIIENKL